MVKTMNNCLKVNIGSILLLWTTSAAPAVRCHDFISQFRFLATELMWKMFDDSTALEYFGYFLFLHNGFAHKWGTAPTAPLWIRK